jgi:hypothetical protein
MLQQLDMLRDTMHILDTFKYQSHSEEEAKGQFMSNYLSLSVKGLNAQDGGAPAT